MSAVVLLSLASCPGKPPAEDSTPIVDTTDSPRESAWRVDPGSPPDTIPPVDTGPLGTCGGRVLLDAGTVEAPTCQPLDDVSWNLRVEWESETSWLCQGLRVIPGAGVARSVVSYCGHILLSSDTDGPAAFRDLDRDGVADLAGDALSMSLDGAVIAEYPAVGDDHRVATIADLDGDGALEITGQTGIWDALTGEGDGWPAWGGEYSWAYGIAPVKRDGQVWLGTRQRESSTLTDATSARPGTRKRPQHHPFHGVRCEPGAVGRRPGPLVSPTVYPGPHAPRSSG